MDGEEASTPHPHPALLRYGCSVASVTAALLATNALGEQTAGVSPLFFAAVAVSAWYGGLGPGLVATAFAGLASAFFLFEPVYSLRIGWDDLVRVLSFGLVAALMTSLHVATRRSHRRMVEARNEAVEANRAKDRFLAVLGHELRNPLNSVLATVQLLETDPRLPGDVLEDVGAIRRSAELEARLVDDLLDLNSIVRGRLAVHAEVLDANALVEEAVRLCRADARAKDVDLLCRLAADRCHVYADAGRLRQVVWNLLRNAVKFTPSGGRITVTSDNAPDGGFRVAVSDTGIGIEPEAIARIFTAFEQEDESVSKRFGGLGLGLAVARNLVERHGGSIAASSRGKGFGATFTVNLPTTDPPRSMFGPEGREVSPGGVPMRLDRAG